MNELRCAISDRHYMPVVVMIGQQRKARVEAVRTKFRSAAQSKLEQLRAQGADWKVERVEKELQELEHELHEFDALPAPDKLAVARDWTPEKGWKKYRDFMALVDVEKSDAQVEADKESVMHLVRFHLNLFLTLLQ
eukprot:COSAG06_NODE_851_length_11957_cov_6.770048_3_plen_136_part_00